MTETGEGKGGVDMQEMAQAGIKPGTLCLSQNSEGSISDQLIRLTSIPICDSLQAAGQIPKGEGLGPGGLGPGGLGHPARELCHTHLSIYRQTQTHNPAH